MSAIKKTLTSPPKLVIFDCDGVVVDSVMVHSEVISENFAKYGLDISPLGVRNELGAGKMALVGEEAKRRGAMLPECWIDEIYAEIFERLRLGVPVIEGVVDVLHQLKDAGIPYCLSSNGSEEKMAIMLEKDGVLDLFEGHVFSAHSLGIWKPDPGLFLHSAKMMGVSPADCVVIEDSPVGLMAAKQAQMTCFGYSPAPLGELSPGDGITVFQAMSDLPQLLQLHKI